MPDHPDSEANLWYLWEHGLIDAKQTASISKPTEIYNLKITASGLDFIEDDGGMSAILRTVTVKIDPGDLQALLAARVESSDLSDKEKKRLTQTIRSLGTRTLENLAFRYVKEAVTHLPDAVQLLQTYVSQANQ